MSGGKQKKVVLIGGFGWKDIGDEAMPRAVIFNLRDLAPDVELLMLSPDPEYSREYHGVRAERDVEGLSWGPDAPSRDKLKSGLRIIYFLAAARLRRFNLHLPVWSSAATVLNELASSSLLFNVGGGNLNSLIPQELYKKCTLYLAAAALGVPVILSGQTIGPFTRRIDRWFAAVSLNRVNTITFRDQEVSAIRVAEIGVRRPYMADAADDAMTLPVLQTEEAEELLRRCTHPEWLSLESELVIAMNLKGSLSIFKGADRSGSLSSEISKMAALADHVIENHGAKVLFVSTDYCEGVDDRVLHHEIVEAMTHQNSASCIEEELDDIHLKGLISLADLAIGARYHFNVFAACACVPFLGAASGVYQQTKLLGLARLCGCPECYLEDDLEHVGVPELLVAADRLIERRHDVRARLAKRVPELKRRSLCAIGRALELLSTRPDDRLGCG